MSDYDALTRHIASQVTCYEPGQLPATAPVPYAVLYGGIGQPQGRYVDGRTPHRGVVYRLIAVSNSHEGARNVADRMVYLIDGHVIDASPLTVAFVSDPIPDRTDPSDVRWTATLEVHHHPRST